VSSAEYRLIGADGAVLEAGSGDVAVAGGVLELRPASGPALRVPADRIASVAEPEPFVVLVRLADETGVELSRLGRMRTQLLAELRDARAEAAAAESGGLGNPDRFSATVAAAPVELHVFEDALLVMADGQAKRIAFSFVADVRARDYTVTVDVAGQDTLAITRLGRRTDEFVALLGERLAAARNRTAAFLGSLLPGLDPMAQRAAAGLLRDGVAVPIAALDAIHRDLSATLLRVATLPGRYAELVSLTDRADLAIGFKQVASVRRVAVGVTPWRDPSVTPHIGQHDGPGGRFGPGLGGVLAAGVVAGMGPGGGYGYGYGGPFGGYGDAGGYWAFRALGAALTPNPGGQHAAGPRASVRYGLLIPETEDLSALTTAGADPTVLAFALLTPARGGDPVAYQALNWPDGVSYVYRAGGQDPRALVNQALDDAGFAAAEIHAAAAGDLTAAHRRDAATSPLTRALVAAVPHEPGWATRVADLLAG
jgi:hypothetical protein